MLRLERPPDLHYKPPERDEAKHQKAISRMLEVTRPARVWQQPLVDILRSYIIEEEMRKALVFLQHVITEGKQKLRHPDRHSRPFLHIDFTRAPKVFSVDNWKNILISLGFEIDQPDGPHKLEHVSVSVSQGIVADALDGMLLLISYLLDLHWNILYMVLRMSPEELTKLCNVMQSSVADVTDQDMAKSLLSSYPDEMRQLGFQRANGTVCRTRLSLQQSQLCTKLSLMLTAVFQEEPSNDGIFI